MTPHPTLLLILAIVGGAALLIWGIGAAILFVAAIREYRRPKKPKTNADLNKKPAAAEGIQEK